MADTEEPVAAVEEQKEEDKPAEEQAAEEAAGEEKAAEETPAEGEEAPAEAAAEEQAEEQEPAAEEEPAVEEQTEEAAAPEEPAAEAEATEEQAEEQAAAAEEETPAEEEAQAEEQAAEEEAAPAEEEAPAEEAAAEEQAAEEQAGEEQAAEEQEATEEQEAAATEEEPAATEEAPLEPEVVDQIVQDLTEEQKEKLREVFALYAVEERIDYTNYKRLMRYMGIPGTDSEFREWYNAADTNGDMIDFDEFCRLYVSHKKPEDILQDELTKCVDRLFGAKDKVSLGEVAKILSSLERQPSDIDEDTLHSYCQAMDTNGDGMVDKMEFVKSLCGGEV